MDIRTQISKDYYRGRPSVINASSSRELTKRLGWEATEGGKVDKHTASDIREVVESRTNMVTQTSSFDSIVEEAKNSSRKVKFLRHSQIDIGDVLGQGGFNQIYDIKGLPEEEEEEESSGFQSKDYVLKVLRKDVAESDVNFALCATDIVKEAIFMSALDHDHILKAKAVSAGGIASFEHGRRPDAFFMVMEKLDETLSDRLKTWEPRLAETRMRPRDRAKFFQERLQVATQLSDAIKYLHSFQIMHRDLKPQNIGFDKTGSLQVFDFGMARVLPESAKQNPDLTFELTKKAGTYRYISPENYKGERYNLKSDVYSFALLLHQILSLKIPYAELKSEDIEKEVFFKGRRPNIPRVWPGDIRDILQKGWSQDLRKRPTMEAICKVLERSAGTT